MNWPHKHAVKGMQHSHREEGRGSRRAAGKGQSTAGDLRQMIAGDCQNASVGSARPLSASANVAHRPCNHFTFTFYIMFMHKLCGNIVFTRLTHIKIKMLRSRPPKYIYFMRIRSSFFEISLLLNGLNSQREEQFFHAPLEVTRTPQTRLVAVSLHERGRRVAPQRWLSQWACSLTLVK